MGVLFLVRSGFFSLLLRLHHVGRVGCARREVAFVVLCIASEGSGIAVTLYVGGFDYAPCADAPRGERCNSLKVAINHHWLGELLSWLIDQLVVGQ